MEPTAEHCARVGEVLADMHLAGRTYQGPSRQPAGSRVVDGMRAGDLSLPQRRGRGTAASRKSASRRSRTATGLPRGVVHADLFRDNVLFQRRPGPWRAGRRLHRFLLRLHRLFHLRRRHHRQRLVRRRGCDAGRGAREALLKAYTAVRPFTAAGARRLAVDAARRARCASGFPGFTIFICRVRANSPTSTIRSVSAAFCSITARGPRDQQRPGSMRPGCR